MERKCETGYEAKCFYFGLPSKPVLVYRTGTPFKRPTGPEAYHVRREVRPVFDHPIADAWDELGPLVPDYLDSIKHKESGPPVLWIGVKPGSLSREAAQVAAIGCEGLLKKFELTDVEVAFRESVFTRSARAGPQLLKYASPFPFCATADVCSPLTPALGLQIAAQDTPHVEGTGALYIRESSDSTKVFVLTARHVVLPPNAGPNELYTRKDVRPRQPRRDVLLIGSKAFQQVLKSTMVKIRADAFMVDHYNDQLEELAMRVPGGKEDQDQVAYWQDKKEQAKKAIDTLDEFHTEVTKNWSIEEHRILGHIAYSPPISVGTGAKRFTEDWALIELDREKIDWSTFKGNVIDQCTNLSFSDLSRNIHPDVPLATYRYHLERLLQLQGVVKDDELRHPTLFNANGERCLPVTKNGTSTGVTIGRASGMMSFVREYFPSGDHETSMELAFYAYNRKDGAFSVFSAHGDSGSIIADYTGRIVGLLTGGCGSTDFDVSYATPFYWLWDERIKMEFPDACLYQPTA
ncbi:hypothetical protein BJV74DRAFT_895767 [Russula compacta]|nr:hypothetical protein BJV74DRAFT_895767 [Russula compacta]